MKKIIIKHSTGKKVLLFFVLSTIVYVFMLLVTIPHIMDFANGIQLLDMMPLGYDAEHVNNLFSALGEKGRQAYMYNQIPVDMIYPFLYGVGYGLMIAYFLKKMRKENSPLFWLSILPIIGGIFDYLENIGSFIMLSDFPNISNFQVHINSFSTIVKSGATTISFLTIFALLILLSVKKMRKGKIDKAQPID